MIPKVLVVIGTRPEAIKLAPVILECRRHKHAMSTTVCVSGQHRQMVDPVLDYFDVSVDQRLAGPNEDACESAGRLAEVTAACLRQIDHALEAVKPDYVVVQGDTVTAMATSLAAFYRRVPLVHVEAGLRTGDLQAPWPEELNRRVVSLSASIHCAPTFRAAAALESEGIAAETIHLTGNTIVDALARTLRKERARGADWSLRHRPLEGNRVVLITAHRRENMDRGIRGLCEAVNVLARRFRDVYFVFPVHRNPAVQQTVQEILDSRKNVRLLPALAYPEFVWLLDRAEFLLSDSGGALEEAVSLGKFTLIARDTTERPEALELGLARLVGTSPERVIHDVSEILRNRPVDRAPPALNPFGDARAAERIVEILLKTRSAPNRVERRYKSSCDSSLTKIAQPVGAETCIPHDGANLRGAGESNG